MATSNELYLYAMIRHQIYLLQYSSYVRNRIWTILDKTESGMKEQIYGKLQGGIGYATKTDLTKYARLTKALDQLRKGAWVDVYKFMSSEMAALAAAEPSFTLNILRTVMPVVINYQLPAIGQLRSIALSRPFHGRILKEWASTMASDDMARIHSAVQQGMVAGESNQDIATRVMGTKAMKGVDGVTEASRRQVQAITRTAVNHISNASRQNFFSLNTDVFTTELYVATLDSRTTPICRSLDGKKFDVGKGPVPPLHFACRSTRVAFIDESQAYIRPANPTTQKILLQEYANNNSLSGINSRDDLPRGTKGTFDKWAQARKRELIGPVPASETYQTWLSKQSNSFQNEVLGVAKAKLFRDGGLKLDKFVDSQGNELTLSQLAAKHADAFREAGLSPDGFIKAA